MTQEIFELGFECFNVNNNGAFKDLMAELGGCHNLDDKFDVAKKFSDELYNYNKNHCGDTYVEGLKHSDCDELGIDELLLRARIDRYDRNVYWLAQEDFVDDVRYRELFARDTTGVINGSKEKPDKTQMVDVPWPTRK